MIDLRKTLITASQALKTAQIKHALIGGFALSVHGYHRSTVDVDFLADGSKKQEIKNILTGLGFSIVHESDEVLQFTGPGRLDILLANRPLSLEMLDRASNQNSLQIYVVCPEDIIGLKIQAYKNDPGRELQDKADIQQLLLKNTLNFELIKKYADLFDEWETIQKLRGNK